MTIHLPSYKVEISMVSPPLSATPVFVDVSADVRLKAGVAITWGRSDAYDTVQASTASFVLDNPAGQYTPNNATSAYYPNFHRGRVVRITGTEDGVTYYPQFYGFIDALSGTWDDETGLLAAMTVTCVDLTKKFARYQIKDNIVSSTILADAPENYWMLGDPAGTSIAANRGVSPTVLMKHAFEFLVSSGDLITYGQDGGSPVDGLTACLVGGDAALRGYDSLKTYPYNAGITMEILNSFDPADALADYAPIFAFADGGSSYLGVGVGDGGLDLGPSLEWDLSGGTGSVFSSVSRQAMTDGQVHHFAVVHSLAAGGTVTLYVDGVQGANVTGVGTLSLFDFWGEFHLGQNISVSTSGDEKNTIAHAAIFGSALTATQIAAHAAAGLSGFAGDTSDQRISRLAAMYGQTLTVVGTAGTQNMAGLNDIKGTYLGDLMTDAITTENGLLYVDRAGALTFKSRLALYNQTAGLTLPAGSYEPDLTFIEDDTNLLNDVSATAAGTGNTQEWTSSTSETDQGTIAQSFTLQTEDDTEALGFAQWRVGDGKPKTRSPQISIDLMTQQAILPTLLAAFWQLPLGGLVALQGLPGAAPTSTVNLLAQGVTTTLTDDAYDAKVNTTDASTWVAWKLQDAVLGVLDSTTVLAY